MQITLVAILIFFLNTVVFAQSTRIQGKIFSNNQPVEFANIGIIGTNLNTTTNEKGEFTISHDLTGKIELKVSCFGFEDKVIEVDIKQEQINELKIELTEITKELEELVITGSNKAVLKRENPFPIVLLTSKQIEQGSGSTVLDDIAKAIPGLNVVKTGPNISKPFIRGLGYNRVLTLFDGIRQEGQQWGDEHSLEIDGYNIERVEVIKGPASLMYGSDALAGVVSFFPTIPNIEKNRVQGKYITEYHTNNNLIGNGLNIGYCNRGFIFSIRGSYRIAKNYRNPIDGRVYLTNFNEKNVSALVGYSTRKGYTRLTFTLYDNQQGIPDGSRDSVSRKFTKQVFEGEDDAITKRPIVSELELNAYKIPILSQHIQHYRTYLSSSYKAGEGNIDANIGIQQNIRREYNHPSFPEQAGMYVQLNTLNYSFRYNTPTIKTMEMSIGINGMIQNNRNKNATDFPIPNYKLVDGGIFVFTKWLKKNWTFSGGVRYDIRHIHWNNFFISTNYHTGFQQESNGTLPEAELKFKANQKIFQGFSASLGTTYALSRQISLKANIGRAFRSPSITELSSNGLDPGAHIIYLGNTAFKPEYSIQEDIGLISEFRNISFEMSIFNNNIQNYIYLTMKVDENGKSHIDEQGNKTYQYQQSKAQLYGGEIILSIHPKKLNGFLFENSLSFVNGINRSTNYKNAGNNGQFLPLIPPLKTSSKLSYEFRIKTKKILKTTPNIEVEYSAKQTRFFGLNNTETSTASYILLNMGFNFVFPYSKNHTIHFIFQITNVLNKAYQSNLSRLKYLETYESSPNNKSGLYNMGRNVVMKIVFPF